MHLLLCIYLDNYLPNSVCPLSFTLTTFLRWDAEAGQYLLLVLCQPSHLCIQLQGPHSFGIYSLAGMKQPESTDLQGSVRAHLFSKHQKVRSRGRRNYLWETRTCKAYLQMKQLACILSDTQNNQMAIFFTFVSTKIKINHQDRQQP